MDISPDNQGVIPAIPNVLRRVDTLRSGPFKFQVGIDAAAINLAYQRVTDAQLRFKSSLLSQVANQLEREVVVSSIFGTNSIEGGKLTEAETAVAVDLDPAAVQEEEQRRAVNLKSAYSLATELATQSDWVMSLDYIREIHARITDRLTHARNEPGEWRNHPEGVTTYVGNEVHGGQYKPPQHLADIQTLMIGLVDWHADLCAQDVPALLRAPLIHYYFELIHPFWDGNGRVGRVLEASILLSDGFRYAPFAQARYYLDRIHEYFTLFNACRKAAEKKHAGPHTAFVAFHLEGMLAGINRLHDRVNDLLVLLLHQNDLAAKHDSKVINDRQYAIANHVLSARSPVPIKQLRAEPWYQAMYIKLTDKTRQRDMSELRKLDVLRLDAEQRLWPTCVAEAK